MGKYKYIFGPVPSRRLGLSLGVDIVPFKTCTQNCLYCQLGRDAVTTRERKPWVSVGEIAGELAGALAEARADYVTVSGSGEPTLNSDMGAIIDVIRSATDIPVAVITNGTLLGDPAVRSECAKADVVLPSLDAGDEDTFVRLNKPYETMTLESLVAGLIAFRREYAGKIWLEVFIVEGINTDIVQLEKIKSLIKLIGPDKVHLNTAVRPTAEQGVVAATPQRLAEIAEFLGPIAEVIADFKAPAASSASVENAQILDMLKRRPCSMTDICEGLGINRNAAAKELQLLQEAGLIAAQTRNGIMFFCLS